MSWYRASISSTLSVAKCLSNAAVREAFHPLHAVSTFGCLPRVQALMEASFNRWLYQQLWASIGDSWTGYIHQSFVFWQWQIIWWFISLRLLGGFVVWELPPAPVFSSTVILAALKAWLWLKRQNGSVSTDSVNWLCSRFATVQWISAWYSLESGSGTTLSHSCSQSSVPSSFDNRTISYYETPSCRQQCKVKYKLRRLWFREALCLSFLLVNRTSSCFILFMASAVDYRLLIR